MKHTNTVSSIRTISFGYSNKKTFSSLSFMMFFQYNAKLLNLFPNVV